MSMPKISVHEDIPPQKLYIDKMHCTSKSNFFTNSVGPGFLFRFESQFDESRVK